MREFILGILFAIPIFAFILLLVRDILIKRFIKNTIVPVGIPNPDITNSIVSDVLVSYKLLLILKVEFRFLLRESLIEGEVMETCRNKLAELEEAIQEAEKFFELKNNTDYLKIKDGINKLDIYTMGDK